MCCALYVVGMWDVANERNERTDIVGQARSREIGPECASTRQSNVEARLAPDAHVHRSTAFLLLLLYQLIFKLIMRDA